MIPVPWVADTILSNLSNLYVSPGNLVIALGGDSPLKRYA